MQLCEAFKSAPLQCLQPVRSADGSSLHVDEQLHRAKQLQTVYIALWIWLTCRLLYRFRDNLVRSGPNSRQIQLDHFLLLLQNVGPSCRQDDDGLFWLERLRLIFRPHLSRIQKLA